MKKVKAIKTAHTPSSPKGMGDYYGSGIRNKTAKMRESSMELPKVSMKKGKPPKALA